MITIGTSQEEFFKQYLKRMNKKKLKIRAKLHIVEGKDVWLFKLISGNANLNFAPRYEARRNVLDSKIYCWLKSEGVYYDFTNQKFKIRYGERQGY